MECQDMTVPQQGRTAMVMSCWLLWTQGGLRLPVWLLSAGPVPHRGEQGGAWGSAFGLPHGIKLLPDSLAHLLSLRTSVGVSLSWR